MPPKAESDLAFYTAKLKKVHPTCVLGEPLTDPCVDPPAPELSAEEIEADVRLETQFE